VWAIDKLAGHFRVKLQVLATVLADPPEACWLNFGLGEWIIQSGIGQGPI